MLARDLLGATLSEDVTRKIADDQQLKRLAQDVSKHLFVNRIGILGEVKRAFLYPRMREHLLDKLPYFLFGVQKIIVPNSKDQEIFPLPSVLAPAHYLFRPVRLLATYAWFNMKRVYGHNSTVH